MVASDYNVDGGSDDRLNNGGKTRIGEVCHAASGQNGKTVNKVSVYMNKAQSPTGTAYIRIYDSANNIVLDIGNIDVSTLTTTKTLYVFGPVANPRTIATDDRVVIEYAGGDASNYVTVYALVNGYDASNSEFTSWNGSVWTEITYDWASIWTDEAVPVTFYQHSGPLRIYRRNKR